MKELDAIANAEFGMDYDQLGPNEKEWCQDELDNRQFKDEVRRFQEIAGIREEGDYDTGTPSGDTDAMNIAEDDFSDTSRGLDNTPLP